jgi:hypothetical protein
VRHFSRTILICFWVVRMVRRRRYIMVMHRELLQSQSCYNKNDTNESNCSIA